MAEEEEKKIEEEVEEAQPERPRGSIRDILAVIPPATSLKAREKKVREKRVRLRYDDSLPPEKAKMNPSLAKELGVTEKIEVSVARRHRFVFHVILDESIEEGFIHVNPELMEEHGVADGSIATVRSYKGTETPGIRLPMR